MKTSIIIILSVLLVFVIINNIKQKQTIMKQEYEKEFKERQLRSTEQLIIEQQRRVNLLKDTVKLLRDQNGFMNDYITMMN